MASLAVHSLEYNMLLVAQNLPNEFFTPESLLTFAGATAATLVVTNTAKSVADWNPRWFGLLVAQVVCLVGAFFAKDATSLTFVIAMLNGCAVYLAAAGSNDAAGNHLNPRSPMRAGTTFWQRFWSPWF
jgi:hypothetical protein